MRRIVLSAVLSAGLAALVPLPLAAADLPPGLERAELLPAHLTADGTVMTALHLDLAPDWKTYWRSPGETGVPPVFDWSGAPNVTRAVAHWPQPEVIESDGSRTLGYHDQLILPIELTPATPGQPIEGKVAIDLGLCLNICVPAHLELPAPGPVSARVDPRITAALASAPAEGTATVTCTVTEIEDGLRVTAAVPGAPPEAAAMELDAPDMWVSQPELGRDGAAVTATADFVGPSGKPFALDHAALRLTLIGDGGAVEYQGCTPA